MQTVEERLFEVWAVKHKEGQEFIKIQVGTFTVYISITSALLTLALAEPTAPTLREGLSIFGVFMSLLALFTAWLFTRHRTTLAADLRRLGEDGLRGLQLQSDLRPLKHGALLLCILGSATLIAWLLLLCATWPPEVVRSLGSYSPWGG